MDNRQDKPFRLRDFWGPELLDHPTLGWEEGGDRRFICLFRLIDDL